MPRFPPNGLSAAQVEAAIDAALIAGDDAVFGAVTIEGGQASPGYVSGNLDMLTLNATVNLTPSLPGYFGVIGQIQPLWVGTSGPAIGNTPQCKAGNNGNHDNQLAATSFPTAASFVAGVTGAAPKASGVVTLTGNGAVLADLTAPFVAHVTTAATGPTTAVVRFVTRVLLIPKGLFL